MSRVRTVPPERAVRGERTVHSERAVSRVHTVYPERDTRRERADVSCAPRGGSAR